MVGTAFSQQAPSDKTFQLYHVDRKCACIAIQKKTKTLKGVDTRVGNDLYEVFWSVSSPKHELFRIPIGSYIKSKLVKTWLYGIASEADFNNDGIPDYAWYGGDDTGFEMHLFLSSATQAYTEVDLLKTLESAWQAKFKTNAPDLGIVDGDYSIEKLKLSQTTKGLVLLATITKTSGKTGNLQGTYTLAVDQNSFVP